MLHPRNSTTSTIVYMIAKPFYAAIATNRQSSGQTSRRRQVMGGMRNAYAMSEMLGSRARKASKIRIITGSLPSHRGEAGWII